MTIRSQARVKRGAADRAVDMDVSQTTHRRYQAVLFDLDGTLRANQPEGFEAFIDYAARVGLHLTPEQIEACERAVHRYWADGVRVADHQARFDERGFWINYNRILLDAMEIKDCDHCAHAIQDHFEDYHPTDVLFPDAPAVLAELKAEGYLLGLVSNREHSLDPEVERYGIDRFFYFTLSGGQARSFKPDPGIFMRALRLAGDLPPFQVVYVGDNYYADVVGANGVGMDAILIDPRDIFRDLCGRRVKRLRDVPDAIRAAVL